MGRKLGATPRFGKAGKRLIIVALRAFCVHLPGPRERRQNHPLAVKNLGSKTWQQKARADRPGFR
jgi:hypothetical protein